MDLRPGDIILYPVDSHSNWVSHLIAFGERLIGQSPSQEDYSHVSMVGRDVTHMFEAYWPKIRYSKVRLNDVEIYRIKDLTPGQLDRMMAYAESQVGRWYDLVGILTFGKIQLGGTAWCSQYVYNIAIAGQIVLGPPEDVESPDDIAVSELLIRINE